MLAAINAPDGIRLRLGAADRAIATGKDPVYFGNESDSANDSWNKSTAGRRASANCRHS
jgi:hypothetical protein